MKISQALSHFVIFMATKEEVALRILPKKKNWQIKRPGVHARGTIMLCLYYYLLLISSYILKTFLVVMFGKLKIAVLESSLLFETAMSLKSLQRRSEDNQL